MAEGRDWALDTEQEGNGPYDDEHNQAESLTRKSEELFGAERTRDFLRVPWMAWDNRHLFRNKQSFSRTVSNSSWTDIFLWLSQSSVYWTTWWNI